MHKHVVIKHENPYLVCGHCFNYIDGYIAHYGQVPRCVHQGLNSPCRHTSGYVSLCRTWSPVDGCQCMKTYGNVPHPPKKEKK